MSVAQRPLALSELQVALSVTLEELTMESGKVVHNIQKLLSCCGGLVAVDEEISQFNSFIQVLANILS